jgi:hypothetical protein
MIHRLLAFGLFVLIIGLLGFQCVSVRARPAGTLKTFALVGGTATSGLALIRSPSDTAVAIICGAGALGSLSAILLAALAAASEQVDTPILISISSGASCIYLAAARALSSRTGFVFVSFDLFMLAGVSHAVAYLCSCMPGRRGRLIIIAVAIPSCLLLSGSWAESQQQAEAISLLTGTLAATAFVIVWRALGGRRGESR